MLPFSERIFVTSGQHLTSVFSAVGMFSTVDDSQRCTDPLENWNFKVSSLLFLLFYLQVLIVRKYEDGF